MILKYNFTKIYVLLVIIFLTLSSSGLTFSNYIIYLSSILFFFNLLLNNNFKIKLSVRSYAFWSLFIIGIISSLINFQEIKFSNLSNLLFLLFGFLPFTFRYSTAVNVKYINLFILLLYMLSQQIFSAEINFYNIILGENFSNLENNFHPFLFGLFSIYFLNRKQYFFFFLNFVFSIISGKRIVIIAILLIIIILMNPKKIRNIILSPITVVMCSLTYVLFSFLLSSNFFDDLIFDFTGFSTSFLTMGRSSFYATLFNYFHFDALQILFGNGFGTASRLSLDLTDNLVHNDHLKLFLEVGLIGLIIFIYLLVKYSKNKYLAIYFITIMLTDNVIVYSYFIFLYNFLEIENQHEEGSIYS